MRSAAIITNAKKKGVHLSVSQNLESVWRSSLIQKSWTALTEWKMMGIRDYVLGLECGNCYPDGRDVMRKEGRLKFLEPGETLAYHVKVRLFEL